MNNCPHFSRCSGCEIEKNILCPPIWTEALPFFEKNGLKPRLVTDGFERTRYKAKLAVRPGPEIGLFKKNTHQVISIPDCLVHHQSINRAVAAIKEEMEIHQISPYLESPPSGLLRYIQLFVEKRTGRIQLVLVVSEKNPRLEFFCKGLLKRDFWHSIWLNYHAEARNRILGETWQLIEGEPFLWQVLNQREIAFHPGAFSQTHLPLFEKMLQTIDSWVEPQEKILELYAGVGAIGVSLSSKAKKLTLVENNPFALLSFQETMGRFCEKEKFSYLSIDAKEALLSDHTLIVVDPPRKGLEESLLKKLCVQKNSQLIYVSCHFPTFRRDSERLLEAGWTLQKGEGYLLFPGTNQVEILALFSRAPAAI